MVRRIGVDRVSCTEEEAMRKLLEICVSLLFPELPLPSASSHQEAESNFLFLSFFFFQSRAQNSQSLDIFSHKRICVSRFSLAHERAQQVNSLLSNDPSLVPGIHVQVELGN